MQGRALGQDSPQNDGAERRGGGDVVGSPHRRFRRREVLGAMLYLACGKRGGEPTAAYEEDPTGITAKVKAQLTRGAKHVPEPPIPDEGTPKRIRKSKAEMRAARDVGSPGGGGGGGRGQAQSLQAFHAPAQQQGQHPKFAGGKYLMTREGLEICFTFAQNDRDACPEPCRNNRAHVCQSCFGPHRNAECGRTNNQSKGSGKGGKGK